VGFEPQKFFIGVIDFFSILLPGAVLTYVFRNPVVCYLSKKGILSGKWPPGAESWVVFLFSSYLLGHFLFFIGSWLDDIAYDPLRKMTHKDWMLQHPIESNPTRTMLRWLLWLCFKNDPDAAVNHVVPIKEAYLRQIEAPAAVNAFQWCKARLALEHPEALATVNRFEADSKFFRSFVPVMLGVLLWASFCHYGWLALGSVVAMGLAFLRYMEQRFKSTQQAYWFVLTLEAGNEASLLSMKPSSSAK
jgi:hypothetical protein